MVLPTGFVDGDPNHTAAHDATNTVVNTNTTNIATLQSQVGTLSLGLPWFDVTVSPYSAVGDGTTDDSAHVQAAIDAAVAAGGGVVYFKPGKTFLCQDLNITGNNIIIQGGGWGSIIKQKTNASDNHYLISVNSGSGGSSDPTANKTGLIVRDVQLLGTVAADAFMQHQFLLNLNACSDALIENCLIKGFRGDGIYLGSGNSGGIERHNERINIRNNTFDGVNQDNRNGISVIDGTDIKIVNNHFQNITRTDMPGAIDIEPNPSAAYARIQNILISGNTFTNIRGTAGVICGNFATPQGTLTTKAKSITVSDNLIRNCPAANSGIFFANPEVTSDSTEAFDIDIHDNTVYNCKEPFEISGVRGVRIRGNTFDTTTLAAQFGYSNTVRDIDVQGNTFRVIGTTSGACLAVMNAVRVTVDNNTFDSIGLTNGTSGTVVNFTIGVSSTGSSDFIDLVNNRISGTTATAVSAKNASHTITAAADNRAQFNRLGSLTITAAHFGGQDAVVSTVKPGPKITVATTAPSSPASGDIWVDTT